MAWTTPASWSVDQLVTADDLNTQLRDNLNALKTPPSAHYEPNEASDYQTTSSSFANVDGTNLALTVTITGSEVMIGFHGTVQSSVPAGICFDVRVDDLANVGHDDGIIRVRPDSASDEQCVSFVRLVTGLADGQHTFKLQWKTASGTATLFAGAGTSWKDMHPQFWVREMS